VGANPENGIGRLSRSARGLSPKRRQGRREKKNRTRIYESGKETRGGNEGPEGVDRNQRAIRLGNAGERKAICVKP